MTMAFIRRDPQGSSELGAHGRARSFADRDRDHAYDSRLSYRKLRRRALPGKAATIDQRLPPDAPKPSQMASAEASLTRRPSAPWSNEALNDKPTLTEMIYMINRNNATPRSRRTVRKLSCRSNRNGRKQLPGGTIAAVPLVEGLRGTSAQRNQRDQEPTTIILALVRSGPKPSRPSRCGSPPRPALSASR